MMDDHSMIEEIRRLKDELVKSEEEKERLKQENLRLLQEVREDDESRLGQR